MPLQPPPPGEPRRRADAEAVLRAWIQRAVDIDSHAGRRMEDFGLPMPVMAAAAAEVERSGVKVSMGAGNVFHARWNGKAHVVVQARPFASRIVRIRSTLEA